MDSACDARQNCPGLFGSRTGFLTAALSESSLQGTSFDLQSALTLLISRMDKMKSNIAYVPKTNNLLHERITDQEQDKVSLNPFLVEKVRTSSEELRPINTDIDPTVGEVVSDQAEVMSTG